MKKINKNQMAKYQGGNCFFTGLTLPFAFSPFSNPISTLYAVTSAINCWNS
jgi:hypothetical protein